MRIFCQSPTEDSRHRHISIIHCPTSSSTFCSSRSVTVATRNEWGEYWSGKPARREFQTPTFPDELVVAVRRLNSVSDGKVGVWNSPLRQQFEEEVGVMFIEGAQPLRNDLDGLVVRGRRRRRGTE